MFLALLIQAHPWIPVHAAAGPYYVDYANGCDTNDGLHETQVSGSCPTGGSGPFAHAPGMEGVGPTGASTGDGCVSNCAAVVMGAGVQVILKGGVVWPNTVFPWKISGNGASSTQRYGCAGAGCGYVGNAVDASLVGASLSPWNAGVVTSVTLTRDLCGWTPGTVTVTLTGGGGTGAAATASVVPSAETDPLVTGCIYHIALTSGGSGYTSAPGCSISGTNSNGSGVFATCVADINRAIMDDGALQASPPDWPCGLGSSDYQKYFINIAANYTLFSGIEARNVMCPYGTARTGLAMIGENSNDTVNDVYVHGQLADCVVRASFPCGASGSANIDIGIDPFNTYSEVSNSIIENGDSFTLGTSTTQANGYCSSGLICVFQEFGIQTGTQGSHGPVSIHGNRMYSNGWGTRLAGSSSNSSDPWFYYGNEEWMTIYWYTPNGGHINRRYWQLQTAPQTLVAYNNFEHNSVEGAGYTANCNVGVTYYFFNEVIWATGTSSPPIAFGSTADSDGGCTGSVFNETMYNPTSSYQCWNLSSTTTNPSTIITQNLHCITGPSVVNPYWGQGASVNTVENFAGSLVAATIQASSVVQSISTANGQGYAVVNLFAPTLNTNDTAEFVTNVNSANLTSVCNSQTYLAVLCKDINGNQRPAVGPWQAGAYQYGGLVLPLRNSSLSVH